MSDVVMFSRQDAAQIMLLLEKGASEVGREAEPNSPNADLAAKMHDWADKLLVKIEPNFATVDKAMAAN